MTIDVRFGDSGPQSAKAYFTLGNTEVTVKYSVSGGVATLDDITVPLRQAGDVLDLNEFNALKNGIENANTQVSRLSFIDSVE